jgi:hypothetical protein
MNRLAKPSVTKEDILNSTDNGLDIYRRTVVGLKKTGGKWVGLCPFHSERTGSFTVFGDRNSYKCFGCGEGGIDAIKFLQEYHRISFREALDMAENDFSILPATNIVKSKPLVKVPMRIDFEDIPFTKKHKAYWNQYLLPEEYLKSKNVFAVSTWAINGVKQKIDGDEVVFAYWAEDVDKVKILRIGPNVSKKDKWRNTVPNEGYLWDFPKEKVDELWIIKSRKDAFCMEYHFGKTCTAMQNEDAILLLEYNYDRIEEIANRKIMCTGSDFQGWHTSYLVTYLTGWDYFNTPNHLLAYDVEDIADVIAEFGLDIIKKDLIRKGML